jgi:hypothetical protein
MLSITSTKSEAFRMPPARTTRRRSTTASPPGGGTGEDTPTRSQEEQKQGEMPATDDDAPLPRFPADVTENLPSYLLQITSRDESIDVKDVTEEAKEKRDGGDSDDDADGFLDHDAAMVEAIVER